MNLMLSFKFCYYKTVNILSVNFLVASIARSLGMNVLISTRTAVTSEVKRDDVDSCLQYTNSVDHLLRVSDFVSIHCPLNTGVFVTTNHHD